MSVTQSVIKKTAKLSKLRFEGDELIKFAKEFDSILDMVDSLKNIDTSNTECLESLSKNQITLRVDEIKDGDLQEELFGNVNGPNSALAKKLHCFVTPKVVDSEE